MIEGHFPLIESAGRRGVQVLCFEEVITRPCFCPSQDTKWYRAAARIPDGHTTQLMREYEKKYTMALVVPLYEEEMTGVYYNAAAVIDEERVGCNLCVNVCPVENCITLQEVPAGTLDPRTGKAVEGYASTHPNNPQAESGKMPAAAHT